MVLGAVPAEPATGELAAGLDLPGAGAACPALLAGVAGVAALLLLCVGADVVPVGAELPTLGSVDG
jgi:hypothetical protein